MGKLLAFVAMLQLSLVAPATELLPEGKMRVSSQHFKNGERTGGREMVYEETPNAQVVFK